MLIDPHEDVVVVDYLVGARKDRYSVEGRFPFPDLEFAHIAPGLKIVAAQDPTYGDVRPHELFPHGFRHVFQRGEGPCMDKDRIPCREPNNPVVYFTAFFNFKKGSHLFVGFNGVLGLRYYAYLLSGHYLQEEGHRTVGPTADPQAGRNLKTLQFFQKIGAQKDTSR